MSHIDAKGYVKVREPDHPRAASNGWILEHIVIASEALGKPLPSTAQVHHANGDPSDNRNRNLVICEDAAYHKLLHCRTRAFEACGNPNWLYCRICKQYGPGVVSVGKPGVTRHRSCHAAAERARKRSQ